ncbi:DUF1007 family protein, partial [Bradyrhizobium sp.]|uniref:DUF1007 family protein n=1 Tax=Bradyrhizobium sp. TaxID=376 RepID=UPI00391DF994
GAGAPHPHPQVWDTAPRAVLLAAAGAVTGGRHAWTFDDMFATYALQGLETKQKGVYTREELAPLAQTNAESLKDYAYFTFIKAAGRKQKLEDPVDYYLEYKDTKLTLHFTLPLKAPVKPKQLQVEVYDPSYFIDFQMAEKDPVKLVSAPSGCKLGLVRPSDGGSVAQTM